MSAYSISKARKEPPTLGKHTPGVGAYDIHGWQKISKLPTQPSAIITKTKKFYDPLEKIQFKLGPGSYNPQKLSRKIQYSIRGKTQSSSDNYIPSPADYHPNHDWPQKQHSFTTSTRKLETSMGPGPGEYQPLKNYHIKGGHMAQQIRNRIKSLMLPGPGDYQVENSESPRKEKQISFSREKKFIAAQLQQKTKSRLPGPGAYTIEHDLSSPRSIKFGQSERIKTQNCSGPGPGTYNPECIKKEKIPQIVMESEKRLANSVLGVPGPGAYQAFDRKIGATIFGRQKRMKQLKQKTPGPGDYNLEDSRISYGSPITFRKFYKQQQSSPILPPHIPQQGYTNLNSAHTNLGSQPKIRKTTKRDIESREYQIQRAISNKALMLSQTEATNKIANGSSKKLKNSRDIQNGWQKYRKFMMQV